MSVHDAHAFARQEWFVVDSTPSSTPDGAHRLGDLPYTWQLDRKGPGQAPGWTYNGMQVADNWEHAQSALELMLASWAEQIPVQAPGDWEKLLRNGQGWSEGAREVDLRLPKDHVTKPAQAVDDQDTRSWA